VRARPWYDPSVSAVDRAHLRFYSAVGVAVAVVVSVLVLRKRPPLEPVVAPAPLPDAVVDWCAEGLEAIRGGGCYAPSTKAAAPGRPASLLVYLHGRYAPEGTADELVRQARVARLATARGYAVLAFRGKQGQCTDPQLTTWWCWPSNERNQVDGASFVLRWDVALREVERREALVAKGAPGAPATGSTRTGRRQVLLGFSNGAYFASLIASRGLAPFDAVAIAHGGPVTPMRPQRSTPPILLIDADEDPSGPEMSRLDAELTSESWPHAVVVREGGHALPDWDVEMALTFFDRIATERLPLIPPLGARTTRRETPTSDGGSGITGETSPDASGPSAPTHTATAEPPPVDTAPAPTGADPVLDQDR